MCTEDGIFFEALSVYVNLKMNTHANSHIYYVRIHIHLYLSLTNLSTMSLLCTSTIRSVLNFLRSFLLN